TCHVWNVSLGQVVGPPFQPGGPLRLATVTADGRQAVTVLTEGVLRLWDTQTGEPLTPARRLGTYIHDATLSPDGKHLALAGRDGRALLWELPTRDTKRPVELQRLVSLLSAQQVNTQTETLTTRTPEALKDLLNQLARTMPAEF